MNSTATIEIQQITLLDSQCGEWLKLPLAAMRDAGPATQTLGGLLKITSKETYSSAEAIARSSRLPLKTVRKQLVVLAEHGWITNAGRERTRRGAPRRTCTIRVTKKTRDAVNDFGVLPWWASCRTRKGKLSWSARAVLSVVIARLMALRKTVIEQDGMADMDADDVWGTIANMGDEDRFRFSLERLERDTGLSRPAIVNAKRELASHGIVQWSSHQWDDGGNATDTLAPNPNFVVTVQPAEEGRCYVEF